MLRHCSLTGYLNVGTWNCYPLC